MDSIEYHKSALCKLCRICGNKLTTKQFETKNVREKLQKVFPLLDTSENTNEPPRMCQNAI